MIGLISSVMKIEKNSIEIVNFWKKENLNLFVNVLSTIISIKVYDCSLEGSGYFESKKIQYLPLVDKNSCEIFENNLDNSLCIVGNSNNLENNTVSDLTDNVVEHENLENNLDNSLPIVNNNNTLENNNINVIL